MNPRVGTLGIGALPAHPGQEFDYLNYLIILIMASQTPPRPGIELSIISIQASQPPQARNLIIVII